MKYNTHLLNSLSTVFYDSKIVADTLNYKVMLSNEAFSFQLAIMPENEAEENCDVVELKVEIESDLQGITEVYTVENVPAMRIGYAASDDWFLRKTPGLYPDFLVKRGNGKIAASVGYWKSIWININENLEKVRSGKHNIKLKIYEYEKNVLVVEKNIEIEVLKAELPKQSIITTNWLHYDCMAVFSKTEIFSEEFFKVAENYIKLAAKNGQNMVLLPAFTPPLDTPVGEERMTAQLVHVTKADGKYEFDFSLMEKFIELCFKNGIEYLEHSHLFTQWGAKYAPKIVVSENGTDKKMFGWHTDAASDEYKEFLHEYLTALKNFLKEKGYEKKIFFHVSDEPSEEHLDSYKSASDFIHSELSEYPSGDALSDYVYYEQGLVNVPIAVSSTIDDFMGKAKPLWLYYIGLQSNNNFSNRIIGMSQERGRILGIQMYYYNIDGFLHWGFNAHHNRLSRKIADPRIFIDMDGDFMCGTSYLVYPNGEDVDASVRLITFRDQMQDTRALQELENLTDRKTVEELIKKYIPDISLRCRVTENQIMDLRDEVNLKIKQLTE